MHLLEKAGELPGKFHNFSGRQFPHLLFIQLISQDAYRLLRNNNSQISLQARKHYKNIKVPIKIMISNEEMGLRNVMGSKVEEAVTPKCSQLTLGPIGRPDSNICLQ